MLCFINYRKIVKGCTMPLAFNQFLGQIGANPVLGVTVALTLGVVLVNGWTDAPNAIATCVSTRAMGVRCAILMAAVFNLLGVVVMCLINSTVAQTIFNMVDFGDNAGDSLVALCAALTAIVIWATGAWVFGIPTSESHALIAGLSGAAIAISGGTSGINWNEWLKVLYGLFLSTFIGFVFGFAFVRFIEFLVGGFGRGKVTPLFKNAQIVGGASMAFMHGAQDGQKFIGVFLLGLALADGNVSSSSFVIPVWLMFLCSGVMALGTSIGGYRIIKAVGMDMVKLEPYQGFAADAAGSISLLLCSLLGIPTSTTHTKTTAIMGVGAAKHLSCVKWEVVYDMAAAWLLTFPGCGFIGFCTATLFMKLF